MANSWNGNPLILDVQNNDANYLMENDVRNGGSKYSSLLYFIDSIQVIGQSGDRVVLRQVNHTVFSSGVEQYDLNGTEILDITLDGNFEEISFPNGFAANGIVPSTLQFAGSGKVLIFLR